MSDSPLPEATDAQDSLPRTDIDLEAELEELRDFVANGPSLMNRRINLDLNEFETRIERILTHVPREIKRARRIVREEQRIVLDARDEAARINAEARAEAEELVAGARQEAAAMVDQSAIKQAAISQAEEIMQRAQASAQEIRERAFAYGRDVLTTLQETVENAREQIARGQEQLSPPPQG
jgi:hypothetical protein